MNLKITRKVFFCFMIGIACVSARGQNSSASVGKKLREAPDWDTFELVFSNEEEWKNKRLGVKYIANNSDSIEFRLEFKNNPSCKTDFWGIAKGTSRMVQNENQELFLLTTFTFEDNEHTFYMLISKKKETVRVGFDNKIPKDTECRSRSSFLLTREGLLLSDFTTD